jgi:hypothetical protein
MWDNPKRNKTRGASHHIVQVSWKEATINTAKIVVSEGDTIKETFLGTVSMGENFCVSFFWGVSKDKYDEPGTFVVPFSTSRTILPKEVKKKKRLMKANLMMVGNPLKEKVGTTSLFFIALWGRGVVRTYLPSAFALEAVFPECKVSNCCPLNTLNVNFVRSICRSSQKLTRLQDESSFHRVLGFQVKFSPTSADALPVSVFLAV